MENRDMELWSFAVDNAENEAAVVHANLPANTRVGDEFVKNDGNGVRKYVLVRVVQGAAGARWAYWVGATNKAEKVVPNARFEVIADRIFNGDQWHFAGMLVNPFPGKLPGQKDVECWILTEPKMREIPASLKTPLHKDALMTEDGKRYEKSKEVYDVDSGESKILP